MRTPLPLLLPFFVVRRLLEEKVGGQLLVLIAGEVSLDNQVALEAKEAELLLRDKLASSGPVSIASFGNKSESKAHPFNSSPLLLRNANSSRTGRQRRILVRVLGEQLQELLRVLPDHLRELRVAARHLLQDGLQHAWLRLHNLP